MTKHNLTEELFWLTKVFKQGPRRCFQPRALKLLIVVNWLLIKKYTTINYFFNFYQYQSISDVSWLNLCNKIAMEPPYRNLLHMGNDQSIKELQLERHLTFRLQQRGIYHGWLETQVTVHMSTQIITDQLCIFNKNGQRTCVVWSLRMRGTYPQCHMNL